jgi:DNA-binding CsgD family transcriptional regulator
MRRDIVLVRLPDPGRTVPIVPADGMAILGRSTHCNFVIDHPSVSRRHALLTRWCDSSVHVVDLGSHSGTFVDDTRIGEAVVPCGRHVRFGDVTFLVCEAEGTVGEADHDPNTDSRVRGKRQLPRRVASGLTGAQREVFRLLVQGLPEKAIARWLGVSVHTAHNHVGAIYRALGVHSRAELMALVLRQHEAGVQGFAPSAGQSQRPGRIPAGGHGTILRLHYLTSEDRDAYVRLLDAHRIVCSDCDGFIRINAPITPHVMRVLSAAVL